MRRFDFDVPGWRGDGDSKPTRTVVPKASGRNSGGKGVEGSDAVNFLLWSHIFEVKDFEEGLEA